MPFHKHPRTEELPYVPRTSDRSVVEIIEKLPDGGEVSRGFREVDDLVGEIIPVEMRLVSQYGQINKYRTPQDLRIAAMQYFEWAIANPMKKPEAIKGGNMAGNIVEVELPRPWTLTGLCTYLGMSLKSWMTFHNEDKREFNELVDFLEDAIKTQKLEHALIGNYNPAIVSKDLGMIERIIESKKEVRTEITRVTGMTIMLGQPDPEPQSDEDGD